MSKRKNILPTCDHLETKPKATKCNEDDVGMVKYAVCSISFRIIIYTIILDCSVQTVSVVEPNKSVAVGRDVVCSLIFIIVWFWIYITLDLVPYHANVLTVVLNIKKFHNSYYACSL